MGRAAIVINAAGKVVRANGIARALLAEKSGPMLRRMLEACARLGTDHADWASTRVTVDGQRQYLVVARPRHLGVAERIAKAGSEWRLTQRQLEVLEKFAHGNTNKVIAATLRLSTRTVEVHIAALLSKAHVDSRAALLAKLLTAE